MKVLRLVFATLAIGVASISTAQARDSFSLGINIGGYPYYAPPPVVRYYPAQPVVYYREPIYYSQPVYYSAPAAYYYPQTSFNYYSYGGDRYHHRGHDRGRGHGDGRWGHEGRGHHGDRHWR